MNSLKNNKMNLCIPILQVKVWDIACVLEATEWAVNGWPSIIFECWAGGRSQHGGNTVKQDV